MSAAVKVRTATKLTRNERRPPAAAAVRVEAVALRRPAPARRPAAERPVLAPPRAAAPRVRRPLPLVLLALAAPRPDALPAARPRPPPAGRPARPVELAAARPAVLAAGRPARPARPVLLAGKLAAARPRPRPRPVAGFDGVDDAPEAELAALALRGVDFLAAPELVVVRPRSAAPCRCATR
jgi:hypothetical protein